MGEKTLSLFELEKKPHIYLEMALQLSFLVIITYIPALNADWQPDAATSFCDQIAGGEGSNNCLSKFNNDFSYKAWMLNSNS